MYLHHTSRKAALLILINWAIFIVCFGWTSKLQGSVLWWQDLNWSSWLTDLSGVARLTPVPAGTYWIVWLGLSCFFTIISWPRKPISATPQAADDDNAKRQLIHNDGMMETHPELKDKILRLHQSLDNI